MEGIISREKIAPVEEDKKAEDRMEKIYEEAENNVVSRFNKMVSAENIMERLRERPYFRNLSERVG